MSTTATAIRQVATIDLEPGMIVRLSLSIPARGPLATIAAGRPLLFKGGDRYLSSRHCSFEVNTRRGPQIRTISLPLGHAVDVEGVVPA